MSSSEILTNQEEKRYVIFPIKHDRFWEMYKELKLISGLQRR